jgi:hypothetical protein
VLESRIGNLLDSFVFHWVKEFGGEIWFLRKQHLLRCTDDHFLD